MRKKIDIIEFLTMLRDGQLTDGCIVKDLSNGELLEIKDNYFLTELKLMLKWKFEIISEEVEEKANENEEEIDIQAIEKIGAKEIELDGFGRFSINTTRNIVFRIEDLIKAVKQLDKEIKGNK